MTLTEFFMSWAAAATKVDVFIACLCSPGAPVSTQNGDRPVAARWRFVRLYKALRAPGNQRARRRAKACIKALAPQSQFPALADDVLALTAVIWHNDRINQPVLRSLVAYDH